MPSPKTFLLTGCASGIGEATGRLLLAKGHRVVGIDIKPAPYALTEFHACDLSSTASIDQVLARLQGPFFSLVNVAGVPLAYGADLTMKVNILGLRHLTEGVWDRIEDGGTVVNVSSLGGNNWRKRRRELVDLLRTPDFGAGLAWWHAHMNDFNVDAYIIAKEAVVVYSMMLAERGLARRINVNSVGPGVVQTPLLPSFTQDAGQEAMDRYIGLVGRAGQPADIAESLVVLAERRMGWVNGVHLSVDGGLTAGLSMGWKPRTAA